MREKVLRKVLLCLLAALAAVTSSVLVANRVTSLESNRAILASIDEKSETVLKLTAASTLASASVSAIPGDTATPIADKLADFTEYFLLILCVLYAEKYLLTVIGAAAFKLLIPCACALWAVGLFWSPAAMRRLALRLTLFALAFTVVIPASIGVSDMVYDTYKYSVSTTVRETERLNGETSELAGANGDEGLVASILERLQETATGLADRAAELLNRYVEALAVLIVTACIIPLLALSFFLWLLKLLTGAGLPLLLPPRPFEPRPKAGGGKEAPQ